MILLLTGVYGSRSAMLVNFDRVDCVEPARNTANGDEVGSRITMGSTTVYVSEKVREIYAKLNKSSLSVDVVL